MFSLYFEITADKKWSSLLLRKERSGFLVHTAIDALRELKGCIAPVSLLTAEGKGVRSRAAVEKVQRVVFPALEQGEAVFLIIKQDDYERD